MSSTDMTRFERQAARIAAAASPPTDQLTLIRAPQPTARVAGMDLGWQSFIDDQEYVPELKWPQSVRAYQRMRTDSQLSGLFRAMTMPIRRYRFLLDPNGADERAVIGVSEDFNIDIKGRDPRPRGRQRDRFSHPKHLWHSLLAMMYGHAYFEQVGRIVNDQWRLRKLVPVMQDTLTRINVADDGGLISVMQGYTRPSATVLGAGMTGNEIPVDRLIAFVWEQEGANWVGRSIFRDCYRNWLIKDRLLRVDAINHERAGGVPVGTAQPGASPREISQLSQAAQQFKVGEASGLGIPAGSKMDLLKLGSGTDVIASIRYHDEAMARLFLHMFIQLGQTETGSRALGQAFIEYAFIAQKTVAQWYCDVMNEHMIEDWVDWNIGEDEPQVPLLTFEVNQEDERVAVQDLVQMAEAGLLTLDLDLENSLRDRFNLPLRREDGSLESTQTQTSIVRRKPRVVSSIARIFS
jgi:hypothetical protein